MEPIRFVIVTGLSGAGKTQAIWAFEDLGFFCVDNLPPTLIPKFAELCTQSAGKISKVALVIDIRGGDFFHNLFDALEHLTANDIKYEILFLEASNEALIRRFKETRRSHPLAAQGRVLEGISEERQLLLELRGKANKVIDTSNLKPKQLKDQINAMFGDYKDNFKLRITVMSFGFKYGIPLDSDLVMDVRFLPNPFYIEELRSFTGNDKKVQDFVHSSPVTKKFLRKFYSMIKFLIPQYIKEGKTNLVVAIGCTGGQHRSVTIANRIGEMIEAKQKSDYRVQIIHRDAARNSAKEHKDENC